MDRGRTNPSVIPAVAIAMILAAVSGAVLLELTTQPAALERTTFDLFVHSDGTIVLTHGGGAPIDVREISVNVTVDGQPLSHQPPVPFFATTGFRGGPTGAFNPAADSRWRVGEQASFRVASTNAPPIRDGVRVRVQITLDGTRIWSGTSVVGSDSQ